MAWLWLVIAGIFEFTFAIFLKLSDGFSKPYYTAGFFIASLLSFFFLTKALKEIPLGTAYAIWTGIGSVGVVLIGILFFREPAGFLKLFFMTTLIASIIALKVVSPS